MNSQQPGPIRRFFSFLGRAITGLRIFLSNLLFFIFFIVLLVLLFGTVGEETQIIPDKTAMRVKLSGYLVDQRSYTDPLAQILTSGQGQSSETVVRDLVLAINNAADDQRITKLLLDLHYFLGGGVSKLEEVGQALSKFKASGKQIIAISDNYSQSQYYLASYADQIYLHPMGTVMLTGFGGYQNYFKEGLDKLAVNMHIFRVGEYKDAIEPYTRNDMSEESREHNSQWIDELWNTYVSRIENQRQLPKDSINDLINNIDQYLEDVDGDTAQLALNHRLVDQLATRDEIRSKLIQDFGSNSKKDSYQVVDYNHYLAQINLLKARSANKIGLIVASGTIYDGEQPPGNIGGDTLASLFRQAREDDDIKAIVLRIDSGGGSAFASEIIRNEIIATKNAGKPIIVSMGGVAASGGYWIAANADEIWATPATITGSIGVFAVLPTFEESLKKLGITTDGYGTTALADSTRLDKALSPLAANVLQQNVEYIYRKFINLVAEGRDTMPDLIHPIAQGRVWTGARALEFGLVDELGYLEDAINAAARIAEVSDYDVKVVEKKLTPFEQFMFEITGSVTSMINWPFSNSALEELTLLRQHNSFVQSLELIKSVNDPNQVLAHCLVCAEIN